MRFFFLGGYKFCGLFEKKRERKKKLRRRVRERVQENLSLLADTHDAKRKSMSK
jgi:hypothetical protein